MDLEEGRTEVLGKVWLPAIALRVQEHGGAGCPLLTAFSPLVLITLNLPSLLCFTPEGSNQEAGPLPGHLTI